MPLNADTKAARLSAAPIMDGVDYISISVG